MSDYIKVRVAGVNIYTSLEDIAICLEELDDVIASGTAEHADLDCVFKALNYLKRFKGGRLDIAYVIRTAERILKKDIEEGRINLW